ncbi:hypothetical protein [Jiangella alkaliphila]|uniref:Uncharacterized protein n=1 Tax=Jiangella alkaliphila TaxID=419479 RepID=A0A1H2KNY7_9ACTN|nr:hypothetical protein [Jiangella alkaliphila]SDU70397.1 hypothetical protein SAMN04488563_4073 [Jiangella alkaliphila]
MTKTARTAAWQLFDQIVRDAALRSGNPWQRSAGNGPVEFRPDYDTLKALLAVPLLTGASSQSGVPALALDVWIAYELRRAGFDRDRVWPRDEAPRVLPAEVTTLMDGLPRALQAEVRKRVTSGQITGVTLAAANLLGKNYVKQVDVVMSSWQTGPELMISTKRMDSSFGKNAANRVEESYGDAKNLRLRHPLAGLGFFYSLRSTALTQEPDKAEWLIDLLAKLGREDDAYDAVGLIVPEWDDEAVVAPSDEEPDDNPLVAAGLEPIDPEQQLDPAPALISDAMVTKGIETLPRVELRFDAVPPELSPGRLLGIMTDKVLANSPVNFHREARRLRREASPPSDLTP